MRKSFKKISWLFNGVMIGFIIAGLIDQSATSFVAGAVLGLVVALAFKAAGWVRRRSALY